MLNADNTGKKQGGSYSPEFESQKFKPGQSGNPAGRPKGSRSKLSEDFIAELAKNFDEHGADKIEKLRLEKPEAYIVAISKLVTKEVDISSVDGTVVAQQVIYELPDNGRGDTYTEEE